MARRVAWGWGAVAAVLLVWGPAAPAAAAAAAPGWSLTKSGQVAWEAGQLIDQGALKAAEAKAQMALSMDAKSAPARYELARIRLREGRLIGAYTLLKEAVEAGPTHAESQHLLIRVMVLGGQSVASRVPALEQLVAQHSDDLGLKLVLAEAQLAAGNVARAQQTAREVLKKAETSVRAMRLLARTYLADGRLDAAEAILRAAQKVVDDAGTSYLMAGILSRRGKIVDARKWLEDAIRVDPNHVEALTNLGMIYVRVRNWEAAMDVLQRAVALAPGYGAAWLNLGAAQRGATLFEAAERSWKRVLEIDDKLGEAHFNLGILYLENPLPGRDRTQLLTAAIDEFNSYKKGAAPGKLDPEADKYISEARLLIKQEAERKKAELKPTPEAVPPGEPAPPSEGEGAPPEGEGPPPEPDTAPPEPGGQGG